MTIAELSWHRPASLAEACELGRRLGTGAAYLAGGTELLPDFQRGRETARALIALDGIYELGGISIENGALRIGAVATMSQIAGSALVASRAPVIADAARVVGSPQIRSVATIGGNFCRAVPCADTPPAAIVCGARVRISGQGTQREMEAQRFFTGPRSTALLPGELLSAVVVPLQPANSGTSYQRFARRQGSALAVASVAVRVTMDGGRIAEVRIALGAVAPSPLLVARAAALLVGQQPSGELFARAAAVCAEDALPITDLRGTAEFRRELVGVLARRALVEATARAFGAVR